MQFATRVNTILFDSFYKYLCCLGVGDGGDAVLLHGILRVHVIEAKDLPDTDNAFFNISRGDLTDPYLEVKIDNTSLLKTSVKKNCLNPVWDEQFSVPVCHSCIELEIKVKDREHVGGETVGKFQIPAQQLLGGQPVSGWYDLVVNKVGDIQGRVNIWLQFLSTQQMGDMGKVLEDAYFESSGDNCLTLYQDADTPHLPVFAGIENTSGEQYIPTRCWRDLFQAINQAQQIIYITGWSVFTGISLLRGEGRAGDEESNIGELLKKKASEGVKVLIMTWNDKSNDGGLLDGMMGTHDEDTKEFFAGTGVICANVPRDKRSWLGLGGTFVSTCYTHHQKTIVTDAALNDGSGNRRLVAFVGGLDITDGRYDTPEFSLFSTIKTLHAGDFYQNCTPGASNITGPRQPWHDIHARVEGPAAKDICQNFMDRWVIQNSSQADCLASLKNIDLNAAGPHEEGTGGPWVLQVFRSITSDSANFDEGRQAHLHKKYGSFVDNSIERAYINLIRNAESYIYIENQYFLGSAYAWLQDRTTLSQHIIPMEITQKIISKIQYGEQFKVYICIPMYPEGDPTSDASQEILYWQFCTMESMYHKIAKAIEKSGSKGHPQDYLNFYCLGKRESAADVPEDLDCPDDDCPAGIVRKTLRHPIYVHSKLMVVDDDYIVVGSANINQRSLGGNRDSEICIGGYQPSQTMDTTKGSPRGGVHTFRLALWSAHLGGHQHAWHTPSSHECLRQVQEVTSANWSSYTAPEPSHSKVHLLPYPVTISRSGQVSTLKPPFHNFPDTTASVKGSKSGYLPAKLTT